MCEMCEKQIVFPFYLKYKEQWLREFQLYDRTMIAYRASKGGKVRITYKMRHGDVDELGYHTESLTPVYENIYVKEFVLYNDELVKYSFHETYGKKTISQNEQILRQERKISPIGRYGKLNEMLEMEPDNKKEAMLQFKQELIMAEEIFQ